MSVVAFASAKASPGVTTTLTALAATWPADRELCVVDLDPAGGDLAVRLDLALEPGLVTLAAAGRRGLRPETVVEHTQALPVPDTTGTAPRRVLAAPVSAEQSTAALAALRGGLARVLSALPVDVLVDCGRLDPASPVIDVANSADLLVAVTRPVVAEAHHLTTRVSTLRPAALSLLLVGEQPYSVDEMAAAVGATPLATLPEDARTARALTGRSETSRALRRSRLLREARSLAEGLAGWMDPVAPAPTPATASADTAAPTAVTARADAPPSASAHPAPATTGPGTPAPRWPSPDPAPPAPPSPPPAPPVPPSPPAVPAAPLPGPDPAPPPAPAPPTATPPPPARARPASPAASPTAPDPATASPAGREAEDRPPRRPVSPPPAAAPSARRSATGAGDRPKHFRRRSTED